MLVIELQPCSHPGYYARMVGALPQLAPELFSQVSRQAIERIGPRATQRQPLPNPPGNEHCVSKGGAISDGEAPVCDKQIMLFTTMLRATEPFEIVVAKHMPNNERKSLGPALADNVHLRARNSFLAGHDEPFGPELSRVYIARVGRNGPKRSNDRRQRLRTPLAACRTDNPAWIGALEIITSVQLGTVQRS
jgi:hypothetical protein